MDHVFRADLNWLPVKQRIIFKVRVFGYKAIQGYPWPCASLLEETVCSRVECSVIEPKKIFIPWGLHRPIRNKEHYLPSTKFCSGGTYLVELLPSVNLQLQFHTNVSFLTQYIFYIERLTTSLPHNLTVCFSLPFADLWTFIIFYTVSDLTYVMRLGMLAWF